MKNDPLAINELSYKHVESKGFKQLGERPIWSNGKYQLHQYPDGWGIFEKDESNVLYRDTNITISTEQGFNHWLLINNILK
jgi:hypothetical protein